MSSVPAGRAAKAASVGAKTVNGPGPLSVSTKPAAFTASTRTVKSSAAAATSTMVPGCSAVADAVVAATELTGVGVVAAEVAGVGVVTAADAASLLSSPQAVTPRTSARPTAVM